MKTEQLLAGLEPTNLTNAHGKLTPAVAEKIDTAIMEVLNRETFDLNDVKKLAFEQCMHSLRNQILKQWNTCICVWTILMNVLQKTYSL